jgi:eukaryotic-like serine/threonine-protein kinase
MLGPFRIVRLLGIGGMATVYEAEDVRLERAIALKVLPPEFLHDDAFAKRFVKEGRVIARLDHLSIVPIYASGIDDGIPWMSMRLLAGGNLDTLLESRRLEPLEIVRILQEVAAALDYAHAHGVVHRDIKPTNLLLDGAGSTFVADFGLAHLLEGSPGLTRSGVLAGTPHYMAPEQALGKPADHRCDIYSLGIVAYEMFVGAAPFTGDSPIAVLLKHVNETLPDPAAGLVPLPVMRAIRKAAAKEPNERWPSALAFVDALEAAVHGVPPSSQASPVAESGDRAKRSRNAWIAATIGIGALATVLGWEVAREPLRRSPVPLPGSEPPRVIEPAVLLPAPADEIVTSAPQARPRSPGPATLAPSGTQQEVVTPAADSAPPAAAPLVVIGLPQVLSSPRMTTAVDVPPVAAEHPPTPDEVIQPSSPTTTDVVTAPVRIRTVKPDYPNVARAAQIEGDVVLQAKVTPEGKVTVVNLVRSVHPLLDEAARRAVLQYEYAPGRRNGIPESTNVRITVSFRMQ